jgi:two-component system, chemotaxis family, CheB/CheR fusion protein
VLHELGSGRRAEHFETRLIGKDRKPVEVSLMLSPVLGDNHNVVAASMILRDIGARKRADELRNLMVDELNHRVKNTLATVQSIVAQALPEVDAAARGLLDARIVALSRTHDLLTESDWEGASLRALLLQELKPFSHAGEHKRFEVEGADLRLTPKTALALGMVLQELTTNAAKFGALSNASGSVHVAWNMDGSANPAVLRLRWRETGGPAVKSPKRKGFGSRLIERGLKLELDASVKLEFDARGLICAIDLPLAAEGRPEAD